MLKIQIFVLLLIYIPNSSGVIDDMYSAGKELWKLYSMIDDVTLSYNYDFMNFDEIFINDSSREIKDQMNKTHGKLFQVEQSIDSRSIVDSLKLSSSGIMIRSSLDVVELSIRSIDDCYNEFHKYMFEREDQSFHTLHELIGNIVLKVEGEITWIRKMMTETHEFLPNYKNIVDAISGYATNHMTRTCDGRQIISEILVHLFKKTLMAELKTSFMVAIANIYQYPENEGFKMLNSFAKGTFEKQFSTRVEIFSWNIGIVESLYLRSCDPPNGTWIQNENYFELENTFYKTLFRYHWGICKYGSCNAINYVRSRCEPEIYDFRTACADISGSCIYLSAITACVLKKGPSRFQFVNSTKLGALGTNFECPKDNGYIIKDGMGWNFTHAACACDCHSTRNKISLALLQSSIQSNRVISGLRFVRIGHILHIQPKESLLVENGRVRQIGRWKVLPNIFNESQLHSIDKENKTFFLDDLRLPPGYVLTGVKFNKVVRGTVPGFALEIFGVPFDYNSGKLNTDNQYRISRRASDKLPGVAVHFEASDSIHTKLPHKPSATALKHVTLVQSSLTFDFGQRTLPFFDAVPVVTSPPSVLGGIGIFHKGVDAHAGLISLRLYGIEYVQYFREFQVQCMENGRVSFDSLNCD